MGAKGMSDFLAQWDWSEPPDPTHWQWLSQVAEREPWAIEHGLVAAKCVALLARALTLPDETVKALSLAGLLHDVGKTAFRRLSCAAKRRPFRETNLPACGNIPKWAPASLSPSACPKWS